MSIMKPPSLETLSTYYLNSSIVIGGGDMLQAKFFILLVLRPRRQNIINKKSLEHQDSTYFLRGMYSPRKESNESYYIWTELYPSKQSRLLTL
jgi:hypothetical protein